MHNTRREVHIPRAPLTAACMLAASNRPGSTRGCSVRRAHNSCLCLRSRMPARVLCAGSRAGKAGSGAKGRKSQRAHRPCDLDYLGGGLRAATSEQMALWQAMQPAVEAHVSGGAGAGAWKALQRQPSRARMGVGGSL